VHGATIDSRVEIASNVCSPWFVNTACESSAPYRWAEYCDKRVCLSVYVCVSPRSYLRNYTSDLHYFCACYLWRRLDRSSSGGVVIRYVLPVLWMTSYLVVSHVARRRRPAEAQCTRSVGLGYTLKLSYRRGTARCVVSVEILPIKAKFNYTGPTGPDRTRAVGWSRV